MAYFLCTKCDDCNCGVFNVPYVVDVPLVPDFCIQSRSKSPKWQKYTKTIDLFKACKEGSELIMKQLQER